MVVIASVGDASVDFNKYAACHWNLEEPTATIKDQLGIVRPIRGLDAIRRRPDRSSIF